MTSGFYCHRCLQSERMYRKSKKDRQTSHGICPMRKERRDLFLKADYSFHPISTFPPRVLPEERKPRSFLLQVPSAGADPENAGEGSQRQLW